MTDKEILHAQSDFAELRELIKGKTLPNLIAEIRDKQCDHLIGICNVLDAHASSTNDKDAEMLDVNFKSLNLTINTGDDGFCTIDMVHSSVEIINV